MDNLLEELHIKQNNPGSYMGATTLRGDGSSIGSSSPINNQTIAEVVAASEQDYEAVVVGAQQAFRDWSRWPAPKRGEVVRQIGEALRQYKEPLAQLVTLEMGKILAEARGEVQEMIDMCDFAAGLSRQLYGLSMHSERPKHRMYEQWHPFGPTGVITAFNFPVAVWAWNACLATICGNSVIWKPSPKTPLTAIAVHRLAQRVLERCEAPDIFSLLCGEVDTVGKPIAADPRIPLVSATGSTKMGRSVSGVVARRFGRSILELGGNNAVIVTKDANLQLATRAVLFGAIGTAGQRCTTTRRLFVQTSVCSTLIDQLTAAYSQVTIGDPRDAQTLMGPLIDRAAVDGYQKAIDRIRDEGGEILVGGNVVQGMPSECYVQPTIVRSHVDMPITAEEVFAPVLHVFESDSLEQLIDWQNAVPQGLSSAMFTQSLTSAEAFLSAQGSDCGIANVNIGTSGAEIGGAFGGEKETGGGREAGSDAWKAYMRRQTVTVNFGEDLPLAQGIHFGG